MRQQLADLKQKKADIKQAQEEKRKQQRRRRQQPPAQAPVTALGEVAASSQDEKGDKQDDEEMRPAVSPHKARQTSVRNEFRVRLSPRVDEATAKQRRREEHKRRQAKIKEEREKREAAAAAAAAEEEALVAAMNSTIISNRQYTHHRAHNRVRLELPRVTELLPAADVRQTPAEAREWGERLVQQRQAWRLPPSRGRVLSPDIGIQSGWQSTSHPLMPTGPLSLPVASGSDDGNDKNDDNDEREAMSATRSEAQKFSFMRRIMAQERREEALSLGKVTDMYSRRIVQASGEPVVPRRPGSRYQTRSLSPSRLSGGFDSSQHETDRLRGASRRRISDGSHNGTGAPGKKQRQQRPRRRRQRQQGLEQSTAPEQDPLSQPSLNSSASLPHFSGWEEAGDSSRLEPDGRNGMPRGSTSALPSLLDYRPGSRSLLPGF